MQTKDDELARLQRGLERVMKADLVPHWLQEPNGELAGLKPTEIVQRGEIDRIWRTIYQLESGVPGYCPEPQSGGMQ